MKLSAALRHELKQKVEPKLNAGVGGQPDAQTWRGLSNRVRTPALHPDMSDDFKIVPLPDGRFRAERLATHNQTAAYVSATFCSMGEARH